MRFERDLYRLQGKVDGLAKTPTNPQMSAPAGSADKITAFSGSMLFVYLHIIWFGCWIGFGVEDYPFGLLTMIVSLEAIFLSTFVMISQNRADAKRQVIADEQWNTVQTEDKQNVELIALSKQILELTKEVRALAGPNGAGSKSAASDKPGS